MTELIVSIDDSYTLSDIRKAIKMIRGVVSVKGKKSTPNAKTVAAIKEARAGQGIYCGSFENYKRMVSNLDDV